LDIDQASIGPRERLGAEIVLLHPTEAAPGQGGDISAPNGFESDVTGFCQQHRTETDGQVCHPRRPFADMGEGMGKARTRMDLEEYLREINPWEPGKDVVTEREQAGWLLDLIEPRDGKCGTTVDLFHTDRGIGREVG